MNLFWHSRLLAVLGIAVAITVPFPTSVHSQAGAVGGTVGKTDKSISGGSDEEEAPSHQRKPAPRSSGGPGPLSAARLMGRWCGEISTYTFTASQLVVAFRNGNPGRVWGISSFQIGAGTIRVIWVPQVGGGTTFGEFTGNTMAQEPGTNSPRYAYHRC